MKKLIPIITLLSVILWGIPTEIYAVEGEEHILFDAVPEVITGALIEQSFNEVPGTMTVITAEQIKLLGLDNLVDVFNLIPGFQTIMSQNNQWMPLIRGYVPGANSHLKIMIDGHPVNEAVYRGNLAWADYPLTDVKQIEIIRGPGSAIYGTDAFSGVLNIITNKQKRTVIEGAGGEFNHKRGHISHFDKPTEDFSYGLTIDSMQEDGAALTFENGLFAGTPFEKGPLNHDREKKRTGASLSLNYKNLDVTLQHAENEQLWVEGVGNILVSEPVNNPAKYSYGEIKYKHEVSDTLDINFSLGYDLNEIHYEGLFYPKGYTWGRDINGDGILDSFPDGAIADYYVKAESYDLDILLQKRWEKHNLSLGFQYGNDKIKDTQTISNFHPTLYYKTLTMTEFSPSDWIQEGESEDFYAPYIQDIYTPTDTVTVIVGARYDDYSKAGSTLSPRTAIVWNAFKDHSIKLSYGKAFFAPWAMARYGNVLAWRGNEDINPQIIHTVEASLQNFYEKDLYYNLTIFYSKIKDRILLDLNKRPSYNNEGDARIYGAELEGKWKITKSFHIWGNYTYTNTLDKTLDTELRQAVRHMGNMGFTYEIINNLFLSSYAHISGSQARESSIPGGNEKLGGWTSVNSSMVYEGIKNLKISLIAKNLLDRKYYYENNKVTILGTAHGSDFPANGRQVIIKLQYEF